MHLVTSLAVALVFGFVGSMPLAGPISLMVLSRAARKQFGEALHIGLGAAVAEALYAGVAFWGFTTLLADHPIVVPISHGVTAVLLLGLGVRFVFWKMKPAKKDENRAGTAFVGFSISALNPTLLVTWTAAVALLFSKGVAEPSGLVAIPFGACAGIGVAAWFALFVTFMKRHGQKLPKGVLTWTVRVLGIALAGLGVWSGVQLVRWIEGDRPTPATAVATVCFGPCSQARRSTPTSP